MKKRTLVCLFLACAALLVQAQENKKIRISCVGASITEGYGTPNPPADSYPGQLGTLLGDGYEVLNFGRGGTTMLKNGNFPYWKEGPLQQALDSAPDIVFIDLGGNDSKAMNRPFLKEFEDDARDMIGLFKALPSNPRIILLTPIVSFVKESDDIWDPCIVNDVTPATIRAAKRNRIEYIDMHPVLDKYPELMRDGIHPDQVGARMMAQRMKAYLDEHPEADPAPNPFITHLYTADPSAHVWEDGRLYIYASHDIDPPRGCDLMDQYHVFSTDDMVNWTDHGEILRASQVPWGRPEGGFMWAPDCAYKNGTYYFYFPHPSETETLDSWKIGVATSKYPDRDFKEQGYIKGMASLIDPCVFVDDDGTAYIYQGGGRHFCKGARLKDNMVELAEPLRDMEGLVDFHEATWVHKRNGIYYLSYADSYAENGRGANRMHYATSTSPLGPWTYRGILLEPTGCDTTHGSIVEYKGQWYLFYHNQALSGRGNLRSICVDKLYYNEDGTIQRVRQH